MDKQEIALRIAIMIEDIINHSDPNSVCSTAVQFPNKGLILRRRIKAADIHEQEHSAIATIEVFIPFSEIMKAEGIINDSEAGEIFNTIVSNKLGADVGFEVVDLWNADNTLVAQGILFEINKALGPDDSEYFRIFALDYLACSALTVRVNDLCVIRSSQ